MNDATDLAESRFVLVAMQLSVMRFAILFCPGLLT
jgi:hypothetical protein